MYMFFQKERSVRTSRPCKQGCVQENGADEEEGAAEQSPSGRPHDV